MCFILYELSKHSEVQQKLFQEIKSSTSENGEVTNETLSMAIYLQAVINETLRFHTIAPFIERQLSSDVEISKYGKISVFSKTNIHKLINFRRSVLPERHQICLLFNGSTYIAKIFRKPREI